MTTLHEIAADIRGLIEDMADGEVTPEHEAAWSALQGTLADKVDAYAQVNAELLAQAHAAQELADIYAAKARARVAQADALKSRMLAGMQSMGVDKAAGKLSSARINKSVSVTLLQPVEAFTSIRFVRIVPEKAEADKKALKQALEAGDPEAMACATLTTKESVVFR
jgi:hypothetical protein